MRSLSQVQTYYPTIRPYVVCDKFVKRARVAALEAVSQALCARYTQLTDLRADSLTAFRCV